MGPLFWASACAQFGSACAQCDSACDCAGSSRDDCAESCDGHLDHAHCLSVLRFGRALTADYFDYHGVPEKMAEVVRCIEGAENDDENCGNHAKMTVNMVLPLPPLQMARSHSYAWQGPHFAWT